MADKPPQLRPLNLRDKHAADLHMQHPEKTAVDIGREVGFSKSPGRSVEKALEKPEVRLYMSRYLDDAGAKLEDSARVIAEAHNATVQKEYLNKFGDVVQGEEKVDHNTRLRAAEINMKAHGAAAPKDDGGGSDFDRLFKHILSKAKDKGLL